MQLIDIKVGSKITVPLDINNWFAFDYDGKIQQLGENLAICTVLRQDGGMTLLGWEKQENLPKYPTTSKNLELHKGKMINSIAVVSSVSCSLIAPPSVPAPIGFLAMMIGAGLLASSMGQNTSSQKETDYASKRL